MMTGGCLCGNIQYVASGPPDFPHVCSCPHCQRLSGGPIMAWVDLPLDGFAWTGPGGEPSWYFTFPDSRRGFCPNCGSNLCAQDSGADTICVTIVTLDDHTQLRPLSQSFKDNAVSWLPTVPVEGL
jgi:hypothetical protein